MSAAVGLIAAAAVVLGGCSSGGTGGGGAAGSSSELSGSSSGSGGSSGAAGSSGSAGSSAGPSSPADTSASNTSATDALSGTLNVFAAASLKATFDQLRTTFLAAHPKVDFPPITYDGSSTLVTEIQGGAPADVFASADEKNMDKVADLVTGRVDFATNTLQIAVAPGNPKHVESLADLAKPGVITVVCAPAVPCGTASQKALAKAGVTLKPASEEQNVTAVLTKVETGDADAGLVYRTDVNSAAGKVMGVDFPEASEAVNTYPIAVLKDSKNAAAAQAFVDLVTSPGGQQVLAGVGFGRP
ncbi:MAG: molybdate ABC transporter substrate-binding protein [Actinobacteria bacterium]|nr:molybdate ABC transporter substrate-binding protein [Actinomycetota bacterium]